MKSQPYLVPEEILLRKLTKRDETAFQWLYDQYAHVLYGVVLTSVSQPALASQIVEEVFVKAWADFDQYNPRRVRLLTWLLNRARAETAGCERPAKPHPSTEVISHEEVGNLIGEEQRILLNSVYFGGQTIAQPVGTDEQTDHTLRHRLRAALQELKSVFSQ